MKHKIAINSAATVQDDQLSEMNVLQYFTVTALVLGLFFWAQDAYMAFWLRRFFIGLAGVSSTYALLRFYRPTLKQLAENRLILLLALTSSLALLLSQYREDAVFGRPLVHPSLLSLFCSITIGLFLTTIKKDSLFKYAYNVIFGWAIISFIFWAATDIHTRLGFLDSQIIYAAFLFAIGVMLGCWHYRQKTLPRQYIIGSSSFLLLCLLLSQTRSALLLLAICLVYIYRSLLFKKKAVLTIGLGATLFVIIFSSYFSRLFDYQYFVKSIEYRVNLIEASVPENPVQLLKGGGVGIIEWNIHENGHKFASLAGDTEDGIIFESSHNYFVDILVERGIVVLLLLIFVIFYAIKQGSTPDKYQEFFKICLIFTCVYLFINNINIQMEVILWACILLLTIRTGRGLRVDREGR